MLPAGELTIVLIFAVLVEMLVEYFVKPLLPTWDGDNPPVWATLPWARYAAAVLAVALAIYYQLDVLSMLFPQYVANYVGMILSGLVISRGANYVHDWIADPIIKQITGS